MIPVDIGAAAGAAIGTGNLAGFATTLDNAFQDIVEGGVIAGAAGGQVHVDIDALVAFYGQLSQVHSELFAQGNRVKEIGQKLLGMPAGGSVAGVQQAWLAMTNSVGASGSSASLLGNLQAVDGLVVKHMQDVMAAAQHYAAQENLAIAGVGKAAGAGTTVAVGPRASADPGLSHGQAY